MKLRMNAKPLGQSYTTAKPRPSINESDGPDKQEKARTICEVTECVASSIFQFIRSRDGQRYNDREAQPEGIHNKFSSTTLGGKKLTGYSERCIHSVIEPISSCLGCTPSHDSAQQLRTRH